jgi:polysaccharide biosynthesis protein PslH
LVRAGVPFKDGVRVERDDQTTEESAAEIAAWSSQSTTFDNTSPIVADILWISPICPFPPHGGNHQRNYYLLRQVARRHRVTLLYPAPAGALDVPEGLAEICVAVFPVAPSHDEADGRLRRVGARLRSVRSGIPPFFVPGGLSNLVRRAQALRQDLPFDIAFGGLSVAEAVMAAPARVRIIDDQNAEGELHRRLMQREPLGLRKLARLHDWCAVARYEARVLPAVDAVTVCSDRDRHILLPHANPDRQLLVVPNGVDLQSVHFRGDTHDPRMVIMIGAMSYAPNTDGAIFLVREVMPEVWKRLPDVRVALVGRDPPPSVEALGNENVLVTGAVPSVLPYLAAAALEVVPLRAGGGTRLKVLEAAAAGVPLVSTSLGVEGLDFRDREEICIADGARNLATEIVEILRNPGLGKRMAVNARGRVERQYSWERIGADFCGHLDALLRQHATQVGSGEARAAH